MAKAENAVVEHKSKIAITGNDVHFFSDWQVILRVDRDRGVLGGKADDAAIWIISENRRGLVLADRLLTDVEDRSIAGGAADDGGQDAQCGPMARRPGRSCV